MRSKRNAPEVRAPARYQKDNNVVSHWWTRETIDTGLTDLDLFFANATLGGLFGSVLNPIADKHYKLMNVGTMIRYSAASFPTQWRLGIFDDSGLLVSIFLPNMATSRTGGINKGCGSFDPQVIWEPCDEYVLRFLGDVSEPIDDPEIIVHLTWEVIGDLF